MKNLPIGIQTLPKIRERNCVYVDKTQLVHQLVTTGAYYFLSRPRRFGKSLLVSTLKELYQGNKAVFEGLWIENNWDWTKIHPVLHFSFDDMTYRQVGLTQAIEDELYRLAALHEIELEATNFKGKFKELIQKLSEKQGKVVVLIDEYDKPIIDFLETATVETAKANSDVCVNFMAF